MWAIQPSGGDISWLTLARGSVPTDADLAGRAIYLTPYQGDAHLGSVEEVRTNNDIYTVDYLGTVRTTERKLEELVLGDGIVAIEWAERWTGRPDDVYEVRLEDTGDERRRISITLGTLNRDSPP